MQNKKQPLSLKELSVFAMFGTLMFCSKLIMEILPNIHLLGMFTMLLTVVFRKKALLPIYLYVLINGVYSGFALWWYPYLYIWTLLWAITMLIPKKIPDKIAIIIYPIICALHGFAFGILYAPGQALIFGFDFKQTVAWVIAGFPFDIIHGISNLFVGILILPLSKLVKKIV
ncbi:MAG: hypothetical protein U0M42_09755 [Acutalibacteraceae bacterium]|nr:hypothetical protein [Acutalibacteraceae bacterium]